MIEDLETKVSASIFSIFTLMYTDYHDSLCGEFSVIRIQMKLKIYQFSYFLPNLNEKSNCSDLNFDFFASKSIWENI